ncbi:MAG: LLM class F420-dependent oxidoreductase [Chloroflexota bacterium]
MQVGALLPFGRTATPASITARAEEAEAAGLESVWVIEDYDSWEAFATLGYLAARTQHVRLGISVTVPYVRNVAMLAAAAATLDRFSHGRLILGLGRSLPSMLAQAGVGQDAPLTTLRDTIEALRALWSGEPTTLTRRTLSLNQVEMEVTPCQSRIPIILGTQGPRGLKLASECADGVVFSSFAGSTLVGRAVATLRNAASAAGRAASDIVVSRLTPIAITAEPGPFLDGLRPVVARDLSIPGRGEAMLASTHWSSDILGPIRTALRTQDCLTRGLEPYRQAFRIGDVEAAAGCVPRELVQEFAIAGSASVCRERLAEFAAAGVDRFIVSSPNSLADIAGLI